MIGSRASRIWVPSVVMLLAGCTAGGAQPGDDVPDLYRTEITRVLDNGPSDLEREALADFQVSDAEYHEAQQEFKQCIEGAGYGFDVIFPDDGGYDIGPLDDFNASFGSEDAAQSAFDELTARCEDGNLETLEWLYFDMRANPRGLSPIEALRECFDAHGVPDGVGLSDQEFEELIFGTTTDDGDGAEGGVNHAEPYQPSTPEGSACMLDPFSS